MPFVLVDESILNKRHMCVVCPYKVEKLFCYEEIDRLIYEKAGFRQLEKAFSQVNKYEVGKVYLTKGFNLANEIIHVLIPDWRYDPNFCVNMFEAYKNVIHFIRNRHYNEVVIPIFNYSYKRIGSMHSYRTAKLMLNYLARKYDLNDIIIYLIVKKRTVKDHINDYSSPYTPDDNVIKRKYVHRKHPLSNIKAFRKFIRVNNIKLNPKGHIVNRYRHQKYSFPFDELYDYIYKKYSRYTDVLCYKSQLHMQMYNNMFDFAYYPSKDELFGLCIGLKLTYKETLELFEKSKYTLNFKNRKDYFVIAKIATGDYDIFSLNELLFIKNIKQLYSDPLENSQNVSKVI